MAWPTSPGHFSRRFKQEACTLVVALLLFVAAPELSAQRRLNDFFAAPLSPTAVFNGSVVEDSTGAKLDVAIVIRGPAGWYNTRTGNSLGRADSLPPGVYAQSWTVGARSYRFRLDENTRTLELFGQRVSLAQSNLVLVTLGAGPNDPVDVRLGESVTVPIREGASISRALLDASAQVRAFIVSNPERPREVSRISLGPNDVPHWIGIEPNHERVVITGYQAMKTRVLLANFDQQTGKLTLDTRFRAPGSSEPGLRMEGTIWPHGGSGAAVPHGAVFSRPPAGAPR